MVEQHRSPRDDRPILLVNAHYHPDVAATATHITHLAEHLAAAGYAVEVCTGRGHYEAGRTEAPADEVRGGVRVRRVRSTSFGRKRTGGRLADYASFHLHALRRIVFSLRYRGVLVLTTPPLLSVVGWLGRRLRGQRYAVWSMDLHPEAEIAAGMLHPVSPLGRALVALTRRGYRAADFVVALGPYMRERILAHGAAPDRVAVVPVWVDRDELRPAARDEALAAELGLAGKFVVAYMGNAGIVHDFAPVLDAMRQLRGDPRVHFLFTGSGPQRAAIEAFAREHGLRNFSAHAYFPREQLDAVYSVVDAHLVSLGQAFAGVAVPFKGYVAMATGRPVLFVGPERCETAEAVRAHAAGAVVDPARPGAGEAIVERLLAWSRDPEALRAMGGRARAAVLAHYERRERCAAFEQLVRQHWGAPAPAADSPAAPAPAHPARPLQLELR